MESLCLFGGSFDPVHIGHLLVARAAFEELTLDRVIFIPAAQSPFKTHVQPTPAALRMCMLRTALAAKPWAELDDQEIARGAVSYTIDTVRSYRKRYPTARIYYLIGEDNVAQLPEWRDSAELARLVEFAVIPRPPSRAGSQAPEAGEFPVTTPGTVETASSRGFRMRFLHGFPLDVSSSEIRARVCAGLRVNDLLPLGVTEIITNNRLYL